MEYKIGEIIFDVDGEEVKIIDIIKRVHKETIIEVYNKENDMYYLDYEMNFSRQEV